MHDKISKEDAKRRYDSMGNIIVIDARPEEVYTGGSDQIAGAIHITEQLGRELYTQLPKDREYMIYTTKGDEDISKRFADFLDEKGYTAYSIEGGYEEWRDSGYPIEPIKAKGTPFR